MSKRNWWQRILAEINRWLARSNPQAPSGDGEALPPAQPEIVAPASSVALWPAYTAPRWNEHSGSENETENAYRENAIRACRAAGLDCIRIVAGEPFKDFGLSMHMLKISDPERGGHRHPGSWYFRATEAGVKRWVWDVRDTRDLAGWAKLAGDYGRNELQWIVRTGQDARDLAAWDRIVEA